MPKSKGSKHFQKDSLYEKYDMNKDGIIDDEELETITAIQQEEIIEEKADAQRRMAWTALVTMIVFSALLFLPLFPDSRIKALADLFGLFYIGMAGVVGAYMGMTAWMAHKK
tara:strand:+ start:4164 stop:4499 length:336 start_codon:yes stop_codon:yes gene_type:complete